jgi:hypothetical protein
MGLGKRSVEMGLLTYPKYLKFHGRKVVIIAGIEGSNVPGAWLPFYGCEESRPSCRRGRVVVGSAPTTAGSWVAWYGGLGIGIGGVDSDRWIDGLEPFECRCGSLLPTWEWSNCRR